MSSGTPINRINSRCMGKENCIAAGIASLLVNRGFVGRSGLRLRSELGGELGRGCRVYVGCAIL